jgi:hypothetical protein
MSGLSLMLLRPISGKIQRLHLGHSAIALNEFVAANRTLANSHFRPVADIHFSNSGFNSLAHRSGLELLTKYIGLFSACAGGAFPID